MSRGNYDYFAGFEKLNSISCEAIHLLSTTIKRFNHEQLSILNTEMHSLEQAGDSCQHEIIVRLAHEFIAPIEREDILDLVRTLGNVTDAIEEILLRIYMYDVMRIREESVEFCSIIYEQCQELSEALKEFRHFKKSVKIRDHIINIDHLEQRADRLYVEAMKRLYKTTKDPVELLVWTRVFDQFEKCCDICNETAVVIENVIMKNT